MQTTPYHKLHLINSKKSIITPRRSRYQCNCSPKALVAFCILLVACTAVCYYLLSRYEIPFYEAEALEAKATTLRFSSVATVRYFTDPSFESLSQSQLNLKNGTLLLPLLVPRPVGSSNHRIVRELIADHFHRLGWLVLLDEFAAMTPMGTHSFTNLIAVKNLNADSYVAMGAHYDSKNMIFNDRTTTTDFIGATDSAVSCALLMHLATSLNASLAPNGTPESKGLQLIFFDGEEAFNEWSATDSLYGSRHLATIYQSRPASLAQTSLKTLVSANTSSAALTMRTHALSYDRMSLFILIDLLGAAESSFFDLHAATASLFDHLVKLERKLRDRLSMTTFNKRILETARPLTYAIKEYELNVEDDHLPFLHLGVPVLQLIPLPYPDVWHTMRDDKTALHEPTIRDWSRLLRLFLVDLLALVPPSAASASIIPTSSQA